MTVVNFLHVVFNLWFFLLLVLFLFLKPLEEFILFWFRCIPDGNKQGLIPLIFIIPPHNRNFHTVRRNSKSCCILYWERYNFPHIFKRLFLSFIPIIIGVHEAAPVFLELIELDACYIIEGFLELEQFQLVAMMDKLDDGRVTKSICPVFHLGKAVVVGIHVIRFIFQNVPFVRDICPIWPPPLCVVLCHPLPEP